MSEQKPIAIILSGCGFLDGAEVRESVLTLLALDQKQMNYQIYAPNIDAHHTINHLTQSETANKRNVLEESARIARGQIKPLSDCKSFEHSGLVLPGGFGVAKNLCDFAFKGAAGSILPQLKTLVLDFHQEKKPIGALCISPALVALCLGDKGVELTIGHDQDTAQEIEKTGAKHINTEVHQFHADQQHKIATTAAYMDDRAPLDKIYLGISAVINQVDLWRN